MFLFLLLLPPLPVLRRISHQSSIVLCRQLLFLQSSQWNHSIYHWFPHRSHGNVRESPSSSSCSGSHCGASCGITTTDAHSFILSFMASMCYSNLGDNQLSGTIPSSIGSLTALTNLYDHYLIPIPIFRRFLAFTYGPCSVRYLYSNQLSGSIPSSFESLTNLKVLYAQYGSESPSLSPSFSPLCIWSMNMHIKGC